MKKRKAKNEKRKKTKSEKKTFYNKSKGFCKHFMKESNEKKRMKKMSCKIKSLKRLAFIYLYICDGAIIADLYYRFVVFRGN